MSKKGTVPGKKGLARPKRDGSRQERVGASKSSRDGSKEGQKRGRKGSAHPKRDGSGQEGVGASKIEQGEVGASQNGAGSGRRIQKRGRKGTERSVCPKKGHIMARRGRRRHKWGRKRQEGVR